VLYGNLAPEGCVVKQSAVRDEMMRHEGPARVFDSEEAATAAIMEGRINKGDVIVVRYEGPMGGPGMREMLTPDLGHCRHGAGCHVALITDGRFSGGSTGRGHRPRLTGSGPGRPHCHRKGRRSHCHRHPAKNRSLKVDDPMAKSTGAWPAGRRPSRKSAMDTWPDTPGRCRPVRGRWSGSVRP
jgi:hypothetical protein